MRLSRFRVIGFVLLFFCFGVSTLTAAGVSYYQNVTVDLEVKAHKKWIGIPHFSLALPSGLDAIGQDIYIDFSAENPTHKVEHGTPSPKNWDMVFTYILKKVSMGPMGKHDIPFFDIKINADSGCSFYMKENKNLNLKLEDVKIVEPQLFVKKGHKGYGHRERGDNNKLEKGKYHSVFPYFSYDWYEFVKMRKFLLVPYPGRVFIVRTQEGKFAKFQVTDAVGENTKEVLYSASFKYHYGAEDNGLFFK